MKKSDVIDLFESVKQTRAAFDKARTNHNAEVSLIMRRLVLEGLTHYLSPTEIAQRSGYTEKTVRMLLRNEGIDPRRSMSVLSKHAGRVLSDNSALTGLEPSDLLLSPLAYLPAGEALRKEMQDRDLSKVTEVEPLVHGINFFDDEIGCGSTLGYDGVPVLISFGPDEITCPPCRKALVSA